MHRYVALIWLLLPILATEADFSSALSAYRRHDYQAAFREFRQLAESGDARSQEYLGQMYLWGEGVQQDLAVAERWTRKAAEQGYAPAQYWLGSIYDVFLKRPAEAVIWYRKAAGQSYSYAEFSLALIYEEGGRGTPQNYGEAFEWYRRAAEHGHGQAALHVGFMFRDGEGMEQDYVQAHMWFNIAATLLALDDEGRTQAARESRDKLAERMTPQQVVKAQEMASAWRPSATPTPAFPGEELVAHGERPERKGSRSDRSRPVEPERSATAFTISRQGDLLTNNHVVDGCRVIVARVGASNIKTILTLTATDKDKDLALLRLPQPTSSVLSFSAARARLGQPIIVMGYPLRDILASSVSVSTGAISALAGPGDDTTLLQITAPVQPGNSGGPLLDQSGNVVGIVSSKIDALSLAIATGDIPQNVNFAINGLAVRTFLDTNKVHYLSSPSTAKKETPQIAEQARNAVLAIECWK